MADLSKFEKMLELLINEDREAAEELFHEIVVEKSRDIYESLLEDEEVDESDDEEVDESDDDDLDESDDEEVDESDEDLDENFDLDEFEVEADPMDMGGDPSDDMMADLGMDDEGGDDMDMDDEGGDTDDRIEDLEDALEDLKAEFEKMMSGDDGDDDMDMDGDDEGDDMDMDMDDEGDDDMDGDDEEEKESFAFEAKKADKKDDKKVKKTAGEEMREYVEKVNGGDLGSKIGGDNGVNNKSIIAKPNNMGGTTANIAKSGTEAGVEANKGNLKGSALSDQNPKDMNTKNVNVPGAKGATKMSNQPGHGAEKKGKPDTADKSATSTLNKLSSRAK